MHEPGHLLLTIPLMARPGETKSPNSHHTRWQNSPGPARTPDSGSKTDGHPVGTDIMKQREGSKRPACYHSPTSHPHVPPKEISAPRSPNLCSVLPSVIPNFASARAQQPLLPQHQPPHTALPTLPFPKTALNVARQDHPNGEAPGGVNRQKPAREQQCLTARSCPPVLPEGAADRLSAAQQLWGQDGEADPAQRQKEAAEKVSMGKGPGEARR